MDYGASAYREDAVLAGVTGIASDAVVDVVATTVRHRELISSTLQPVLDERRIVIGELHYHRELRERHASTFDNDASRTLRRYHRALHAFHRWREFGLARQLRQIDDQLGHIEARREAEIQAARSAILFEYQVGRSWAAEQDRAASGTVRVTATDATRINTDNIN
jgi:hypothetical protein